MAGPWALDEESIASLEARPGVYVLGRVESGVFHGLYVGRADADLQAQLRAHLPGREADAFLRPSGADRFCAAAAATAAEAYRIERTLLRPARHPADPVHPVPRPGGHWTGPAGDGVE